jgi:hypothetical protein
MFHVKHFRWEFAGKGFALAQGGRQCVAGWR